MIGRSLCRDSSFFSSSVDTSLIRPERAWWALFVHFSISFRCRGLRSIFVNVDVDLDHFRQYTSPDDEEQCEKVVGFWHFRESSSGSLSIAS